MASIPTWQSLKRDLELYLKAHPEKREDLLNLVLKATQTPASTPLMTTSEIPEHAVMFDDAIQWYEQVRELGKGRHIVSADHVNQRLLGYAIYDDTARKTHYLLIPDTALKATSIPLLQQRFQTPQKRQYFAQLVSEGKAPPAPKSLTLVKG